MASILDEYTLPEEKIYLRISGYHKVYFAPGELSKIANYDKASCQNFLNWHLHHRLELNPDGTTYKTRKTLIAEGLYYKRPATELIFLTESEHMAIHTSAQHKCSNRLVAESTRVKMRDAKIKSNDTERRFQLVQESIDRGDTLCFRDYAFYRRYCQRNGIPFNGCKVDKTSKVSTIDFKKPVIQKPPKNPMESKEFLEQVHRYRVLKANLRGGNKITRSDIEFLQRFCFRHGWALPEGITPMTP